MDQDCKLKLGDLIEIFRNGYEHWVIYVGEGNVIHLVKNPDHSDTGATVKKEKLRDVVGYDGYRINNHLDDQYEPHPLEDIQRRAESFEGKAFPYNVLKSNCEQFVTLLKYGKPQSQQVQHGKDILIAGLLTAAGVFGSLLLGTLTKKLNQDQ
ncbi:phospholipase A and acyltransferase 4-like [Onychostoma macrolepis]|uniref:phospholipase A and acyltransferase 4-like n=1 Tax=Onychostoma macrolepis TaxID=369639 RepID=UPI00272A86A7|nr:phospholipase A and acyltransferase 4-like [Onychostoma macrolepis]